MKTIKICMYKFSIGTSWDSSKPNSNGNKDVIYTLQSILDCCKNVEIYLLDPHKSAVDKINHPRFHLIKNPNRMDKDFYIKYFKKEKIDFDLFLWFSGIEYHQCISDTFMNLKGTGYLVALDSATWNISPFNFRNSVNEKIPFIFLNNDPKHIRNLPRDLRVPIHILTQCENIYNKKEFIQWANYNDLEFVQKPNIRERIFHQIPYSYGFNDFISVYGKKKIPIQKKEIDLTIIANRGLDDWREKELLKWTEGIDCNIYGNIERPEDERFKGTISSDNIDEILQKSKYTFCIPIDKKWITSKWIESIANNCMPFLHPEYAVYINEKPFPQDLYVNSPDDLKKKIDYLNKNPKIYEKIMKKCRKIVEDFEVYSGEKYLKNMFDKAGILDKIEWYSKEEIEQHIDEFNQKNEQLKKHKEDSVLDFE